MSINIKIKEFLGESYSIEDAILLREIVKNNFLKQLEYNVFMEYNLL